MQSKDKNHPEKIGKFVIKHPLSETNSSDLYEAFDPDLETSVALKYFNVKKRMFDSLPYEQDDWLRRFISEARTLAQIDHPYVVSVRELSYHDGNPFYVMPLHDRNLRHEIGEDYEGKKKGRSREPVDVGGPRAIDYKRGFEIAFQLAGALTAFHQKGIVHRDIKPSNLLLTKVGTGHIKLCDPGLAKFNQTDDSIAGYWLGTPDYIAPEQKRTSHNVDARADIYSWGVVTYRMLTGKLPIGIFTAPRQDCKEMPRGLNDLIMKCLSNKVENRPEDAFALLRAMAPLRAKSLKVQKG